MNEQTTKANYAEWTGFCPICKQHTRYVANGSWFREYLICEKCHNGSAPRERALMKVIEQLVPNWRGLSVHESSPAPRGASVVLARECKNYTPSQLFAGRRPGEMVGGVVCQNLEKQSFADETFDLVVTQDVFEHVFHPDQAHREIWRTLKPGGYHIHTAPIYKEIMETRIVATISNGVVAHLEEKPEYHGNPVDPNGSLVTVRYGYDVADKIAEWAPFDVEVRRFNDKTSGIVAEFSEVIICRKRPQ